MSQMKPSIHVNPQYATNNIDTLLGGWYQISPNTSNIALRVSYSNIEMQGEIRLNTSTIPPVFQGNNGSAWVDFNALQGNIGLPGTDFTNAINFNNLGLSSNVPIEVPLASVFATTYANVAASISNVNIRSLEGGQYIVNSNLSIDSSILYQNSNIITITSQPLPYKWDFTGTQNTVSYLKNNPISDNSFYSWGETSKWIVQNGMNITKGQAVRLTRDSVSSSNIVITPVSYSTLIGVNPFATPFNMLGIATETSSSGNTCIVCTKGITTALCTSNITSDFTLTTQVPFVGVNAIVGRDGGMFCTTNIPTVDYIRAGYFLESGIGASTNGNYILLYVDPKV